MKELKQIFHPYWLWEDHVNGFYENNSGNKKEIDIQKVVAFFNDEKLVKQMMEYVIENWKYSCEHNLTNNAMNKIAYLGQAAVCAYSKIPSTTTMEAWSELTKEVQDRADKIALETLEKYFNNKNLQLCLNLD